MTKYEKGKQRAREKAQQIQIYNAETRQSWQQVADTCADFEKLAKRYGLVKEFKINGII